MSSYEVDPNRVIVRLQNELAEVTAQKVRYMALVDQLNDRITELESDTTTQAHPDAHSG